MYDLTSIDEGWAIIVAAVIGGMIALIVGILSISARNGVKLVLGSLVTLLAVISLVGIFYVAVILPQTPKQIILEAKVAPSGGASMRSAPSPLAPILDIVEKSTSVKIYAQVVAQGLMSDQQTWYLVSVVSHGTSLSGYMLDTWLEFVDQPNHIDATPPIVTLTPVSRP